MPRTLPWLSKPAPTPTPPRRKRGELNSSAPKRRRPSPVPSTSSPARSPTKKPAHGQCANRTPSTSPPPHPPSLPSPMRPDRTDDTWIMVEDELFSTAQLFTQHLHHAEYMRLKKLASCKAPEDIRRPSDGKTRVDGELKAAMERRGRAKQLGMAEQCSGSHGGEEYDGEREAQKLLIGDRNLASLMSDGHRGDPIAGSRVTSMTPLKTRTRAAAGFGSPRKSRTCDHIADRKHSRTAPDSCDHFKAPTSPSESDDLDAPILQTCCSNATPDVPCAKGEKGFRECSHRFSEFHHHPIKHDAMEPASRMGRNNHRPDCRDANPNHAPEQEPKSTAVSTITSTTKTSSPHSQRSLGYASPSFSRVRLRGSQTSDNPGNSDLKCFKNGNKPLAPIRRSRHAGVEKGDAKTQPQKVDNASTLKRNPQRTRSPTKLHRLKQRSIQIKRDEKNNENSDCHDGNDIPTFLF